MMINLILLFSPPRCFDSEDQNSLPTSSSSSTHPISLRIRNEWMQNVGKWWISWVILFRVWYDFGNEWLVRCMDACMNRWIEAAGTVELATIKEMTNDLFSAVYHYLTSHYFLYNISFFYCWFGFETTFLSNMKKKIQGREMIVLPAEFGCELWFFFFLGRLWTRFIFIFLYIIPPYIPMLLVLYISYFPIKNIDY